MLMLFFVLFCFSYLVEDHSISAWKQLHENSQYISHSFSRGWSWRKNFYLWKAATTIGSCLILCTGCPKKFLKILCINKSLCEFVIPPPLQTHIRKRNATIRKQSHHTGLTLGAWNPPSSQWLELPIGHFSRVHHKSTLLGRDHKVLRYWAIARF